MKWAGRIFTLLLRLYPPDFHDDFGEEMTMEPFLGTTGTMAEFWSIAPEFIFLKFSVGQWLLLRRLPQAGWWIVANVMGWALLR